MINFGKKKEKSERTVYIVNEKESPFMVTEAFRQLMTNVNFAIPKKEDGTGKVVCITSSEQCEGKSTVSVNLALTIARSGVKTVLLDCDMRKPRVNQFFKTKNSKGIVAYLSGEAELQDVLIRDEESGLYVLPCTDEAPNPIFLLNNPIFSALIQKLAQEFEYVIVDTPPVGIVADATLVGKLCDGVVCVVKQMQSDHKVIGDTLNQLEFAGCRFLGFVLNGFIVTHKSYYSKKYGKSGYAYKK